MGSKNVMEHPSGSTLPELARAITSGAVRLAAATADWLRLVAEFDERGGWHGVGINSCGHWLAWQCGMSPTTAREHVRYSFKHVTHAGECGGGDELLGAAGAQRSDL